MNLWDNKSVVQQLPEATWEKLEILLATYLTDGHHNGVAIGVRNIDPMIFRHLADKQLIRTVFPVRGTGDTWCLGAYFPKRLSDIALSLLEWPAKPRQRIKDEPLKKLNLSRTLRWVIEYEGSIFMNFWGNVLMMMIEVCQYEDITAKLPAVSTSPRERKSIRETANLLYSHGLSPSRLWLDKILNRFIEDEDDKHALRTIKSYQMDMCNGRTAISHNYLIYTICSKSRNSWMTLSDLTLQKTWKNLTTSIDLKAQGSVILS